MKKRKFLTKVIGAVSSALLLAMSMAPAAVSAATTSGYLDLNSSVVLKGHAFIYSDLDSGLNILTDSDGYKYEVNSTSIINSTGLYLYLENTFPAVVDSITCSGVLNIVAGIGTLRVQPAAASAAVDVKAFKMMGLQTPASVSISGDRNIGLRSVGNVEVNGISRLTISGAQDGISTSGCVKAVNRAQVTSTGVYGVGIRAAGSVWGDNNVTILAEATSGTVGIQTGTFVKASNNTTVTGIGLDKGIHAKSNILSEYNSFVIGQGTASSGTGVMTEGYLKDAVNSCVEGTGGQYGILVYRNILTYQNSLLTGTASYGVGIRANNNSGYNKISMQSDVEATGGEYAFSSGKSLVVETGSTMTLEATVGAGLRLDTGYLTVQNNSARVSATGVTGGIDIAGPTKYGVIVKNAGIVNATSTSNDSSAILLRSKGSVYVGLGAILNAYGMAYGINIYYGTLYVDNALVQVKSSLTGTPVKANAIKKVNNAVIKDYRR